MEDEIGGRKERRYQRVEVFVSALVIPTVDLHLEDRAVLGEGVARSREEFGVMALDIDFDDIDASSRIPNGIQRFDVGIVSYSSSGVVFDGRICGEGMFGHDYIGAYGGETYVEEVEVRGHGGIETKILRETREVDPLRLEGIDRMAESKRDRVQANVGADIENTAGGTYEAAQEQDIGVVILAGCGSVPLFQRPQIEFHTIAEAHVDSALGFTADAEREGACLRR